MTTTVQTETYERIPLSALEPSATNPRKHFAEEALASLAASVAEKGVLEPILVRPIRAGKFEIIAGERRFHASKRAGRSDVPALIRQYSDQEVLEIQLVENLQRDDLDPLEQAAGFKALIASNPEKHTAASIATRIGMSEAWVWDRLKLNDLVPEAKRLLGAGKMAIGHAILIARQKPEDQKRIIDPDRGGLFVGLEHGLEFDGDSDPKEPQGKYDDVKPVTVRELDAWISRHIRFDVEHMAQAVPMQFEQVAEEVAAAAARPGRGKKVIAITFDHMPADDAKDPEERTYGVRSWRRADGTEKSQEIGYPPRMVDSPTCEYSVLGVVAVGREHYGEAFQVCIARDKCRVHWGKEIAEREKSAKLREQGKTGKADARDAQRREREERAQQAEKERRERFEALKKVLNPAARKAAAGLKAPSPKLFALVLKSAGLPASTKPAELAVALVRKYVDRVFTSYAWHGDEAQMVAWAEALGVDVKALRQSLAEPKAEKRAKRAK